MARQAKPWSRYQESATSAVVDVGVSGNRLCTFLGCPYNKSPTILGSIVGPMSLENSHVGTLPTESPNSFQRIFGAYSVLYFCWSTPGPAATDSSLCYTQTDGQALKCQKDVFFVAWSITKSPKKYQDHFEVYVRLMMPWPSLDCGTTTLGNIVGMAPTVQPQTRPHPLHVILSSLAQPLVSSATIRL